MEMSQYITTVLKAAPHICMSWGMCNLIAYTQNGMEGVRFEVNGFKYRGRVAVLYDEGADAFEVELQDMDGTTVSRHPEVYLNELVGTIDELVEKTLDYDEAMAEWLASPGKTPAEEEAKAVERVLRKLREEGFDGEIRVIG